MIDVSLKLALEVSIARSEYKNQTDFCNKQGVSASLLQPMKKDSPQCQWRTLNLVSSKLGLSIVDFLKNGVKEQ